MTARFEDFERARVPLDIGGGFARYGEPGSQLDQSGRPLPPVLRFPDHYSPPEDAVTFTRMDFYVSAGNDNSGVLANLQITLPQDSVGVIRDFARYVNDMVATDNITWDLRVNQQPSSNWSAVRTFPTAASFRSVDDDPYILLPSGATVDVIITNNTAQAHANGLGASFYGWYWPNRKAGV